MKSRSMLVAAMALALGVGACLGESDPSTKDSATRAGTSFRAKITRIDGTDITANITVELIPAGEN